MLAFPQVRALKNICIFVEEIETGEDRAGCLQVRTHQADIARSGAPQAACSATDQSNKSLGTVCSGLVHLKSEKRATFCPAPACSWTMGHE